MKANSKIEFTTYDISKEVFSVSTTVVELLRDWYGDCNMCPANDADIQKVIIDNEYHAELCSTEEKPVTFDELMTKIEGSLKPVATDIEWDLDDIEDTAERDAVNENILPSMIEIPTNIAGEGDDAITEHLSDTYGYCVKGYSLTWEDPDSTELYDLYVHDIKD